MGKKCHRQDDPRICGAKTVVVGQSTVTIDGKLWAVRNDLNSHGAGQLINTTGSSVTINGKPVIVHGADNSQPDNLCPDPGGTHCNPQTADGAAHTFCYP